MSVCKKLKKIHRRYPDSKWDYKAISCLMEHPKTWKDIDVIFYTLVNKGEKSTGVEVYSGPNYVPPFDSRDKSYSKSYKLDKVPSYLKEVVKLLQKEHNKSKWSKKKKVDLN